MAKQIDRGKKRNIRRKRIRSKIHGTLERPRMSIYRSLNHLYVQLINDDENKTLVSVSTLSKDLKEKVKKGFTVETAKMIGKEIAERAQNAKIDRVVFDRGGYKYHGKVKAVAEAARENGLKI